MAEKISKQFNVQTVAWIPLAAFCLIHSENQERFVTSLEEACLNLGPRTIYLLQILSSSESSHILH